MTDIVQGILQLTKKAGVLRDPRRSFRPDPSDPVVPRPLIDRFALVEGARVSGPCRWGGRGPELTGVDMVCGLAPGDFKRRTGYADLVAISPTARFNLGAAGDMSMRVVDIVAPIGKGTRGLIASPPKAGKTEIIKGMAQGIRAGHPDTRIIVLLIDERPEEVTMFRRAVDAEVLSSSSDQSPREHVELAELTLAHVRCELECGHDVVLLVDSLTRMGRAFNLKGSGSGRTMSGGVDAGALEVPRRFFGLARNIEGGGSVTIIATALIDTGSRMDDLIFEEFKGTGNSEIVLDRRLAEQRVFPAIDIAASGTRREAELFSPDDAERIAMIRKTLAERRAEDAVTALVKALEKHPDNAAFLASVPLPGR
ncbi:MAG: transcription termination factor Rho [Nitrospirae bacterium]|nr:transcription termination factor Rho [Nitrospirota bacterium]